MLTSSPPNPNSSFETADWVEYMIAYMQAPMSESDLSSFIEASSGEEPKENFLDDVFEELQKRENLYGTNPPFHVENNLIYPLINWKQLPEYMACLILNIDGVVDKTGVTTKLFERISNEAIKNYLGGDSLVYGFPSQLTPTDVAKKIYGKLNNNPPSFVKDRGLDVVAWKPFDDKRNNNVIVFLQCAAGKNWKDKTNELSINAWCTYITLGCRPIKGFALPIILSDDYFMEVSISENLILDRIRIYKNIQSPTPNTILRAELLDWCNSNLN